MLPPSFPELVSAMELQQHQYQDPGQGLFHQHLESPILGNSSPQFHLQSIYLFSALAWFARQYFVSDVMNVNCQTSLGASV